MAKDDKVTIEQLTDFCNLFLDCYKEQLGFLRPGQARRNYRKALAKHRRKRRLDEIMQLYDAARRNRDKGNKRKELFAGRCEGIAMTLSKLGYRIVKQGDTCVALPTAECDVETFGEGKVAK